MITRISLLIAAVIMAVALLAAPAFAASPSQQECEAQGGTFSRDQGQVSCVYPEVITPGKNEKQEKFQQTSQTTETGQGNSGNKEDSDTTTTCGDPCPPGQFK